MPAATATLSESTPLAMGIESHRSTSTETPSVSLPSTNATRAPNAAPNTGSPSARRPITSTPARRSRPPAAGPPQRVDPRRRGGGAVDGRPERHAGRRLDHERPDVRRAGAGEDHAV